MKITLKIFFEIFLLLIGLFSITVVLVLSTEKAGHYLFDKLIVHFNSDVKIHYSDWSGTFIDGVEVKDLVISDINKLSDGSRLLVQNLSIKIFFWPLPDYKIKVSNARLKLTDLETVLINGNFSNKHKDFNLYTSVISYDSIKDYLPDFAAKSIIDANIKDLDIQIEQEGKKYNMKGDLFLLKGAYGQFNIVDAKILIDADLSQRMEVRKLRFDLKQGQVWGDKTAKINLNKAYFLSEAKFDEAQINIDAYSKVASVDIAIKLRGSYLEPELILSSKPVLPQKALLAMLVTDRRWKSLEGIMVESEVAPDIALGLLDYFLFSKQGNFLVDKLGISDVKIKVQEDNQSISVSQDIGHKIGLEYGAQQEFSNSQQINSYRLKGALKVTDKLSVGVEQNTKQEVTEEQQTDPQSDQTISLEFKTNF